MSPPSAGDTPGPAAMLPFCCGSWLLLASASAVSRWSSASSAEASCGCAGDGTAKATACCRLDRGLLDACGRSRSLAGAAPLRRGSRCRAGRAATWVLLLASTAPPLRRAAGMSMLRTVRGRSEALTLNSCCRPSHPAPHTRCRMHARAAGAASCTATHSNYGNDLRNRECDNTKRLLQESAREHITVHMETATSETLARRQRKLRGWSCALGCHRRQLDAIASNGRHRAKWNVVLPGQAFG